MDEARATRISKYLSKHLRHAPEKLGLKLGPGGWVGVDDLLRAARLHGFRFSREELDEVVATNNKQRFALDATNTQIRANQGHSVPVDLELEPQVPPPILYHGTGAGSVAAIQEQGLRKMNRHAVHLSVDQKTAQRVGARHGRPVVFAIDAAALHAAGQLFYCAANGVWLTDAVPAAYLRAI